MSAKKPSKKSSKYLLDEKTLEHFYKSEKVNRKEFNPANVPEERREDAIRMKVWFDEANELVKSKRVSRGIDFIEDAKTLCYRAIVELKGVHFSVLAWDFLMVMTYVALKNFCINSPKKMSTLFLNYVRANNILNNNELYRNKMHFVSVAGFYQACFNFTPHLTVKEVMTFSRAMAKKCGFEHYETNDYSQTKFIWVSSCLSSKSIK